MQNIHFHLIPGLIKYFAIVDRDNIPVFLFNFSDEEKEIDYELMIFSSLDLIEYKEIQKKSKQNLIDDYLGLLMPFYENEYDLASYGYIGNNGFKLIALKKIENSIQETSSDFKLKNVSIILNDLFLRFLKIFMKN